MFPSHFTAIAVQNCPMRTRPVASAAVLALALVVAPVSATEKPKPTPPTISQSAERALKALPEEFRKPVRQFLLGRMTREAAIDAINRAYAAAIKTAQRDFKSARSSAAAADEKMNADAKRKAAIAATTASRQDAIDQLGPASAASGKLTPAPSTSPSPDS